jgi:hypothetical protein
MQTRRPVLEAPPLPAGLDPAGQHQPLSHGAQPSAALAHPPSQAEGAADGGPLPLDPATITLSLPIAISLGQLNVPAAAGWAAILILYKAVTAPGVARGTLDFLVDGLAIEGDVRERLGVPARVTPAGHDAQRPSRGGPTQAVRDWRAAVASRRQGSPAASSSEEGDGATHPAPAATGTTTHLPSLSYLLDIAPAETPVSAVDEPLNLAEALARLPAVAPIRELTLDPRPLAVPLGRLPSGEARWVDLAEDVVNVGVYGTTGAGKDLLLLQWFVLLCRRNRPAEVQFIVLDGKGDWLLPQLTNLAHMRVDPAGGYGNVEAIKGALDVIHQEARERERLIFGGGHRSREHYIAATGRPLPLLVVIVTDLMTTIQGYVEEELAELISKARALGIRVVMSFQNPTGKDMGWRSNIGLVLAGCMVDGSQDPVVLGIRRLQDMRYRPSQLPNPRRSDPATKGLFVVRHGTEQLLVKAPYLDDDALLALCAHLPRRAGATAPSPATTPRPPAETSPSSGASAVEGEVQPTEAPVAAEDELLAALLRSQEGLSGEAVREERRRRWPGAAGQRAEGRRRTGGRWAARAPGRSAGTPTLQQAAPAPLAETAPPADGGLSPLPPLADAPGEDDRLLRMMLVPLGFNAIHRALQTDRGELSKRCAKLRQEHGLGPWPPAPPKLDRRVAMARMVAVPMGFNECFRALKGDRNALSKIYQELTGQDSQADYQP